MTTAEAAPFEHRLAAYADLAHDALMAALPSTGSDRYLVLPVAEYPSRRGKGLRPALLMATCEAFGGTTEDAMASAVAIEMLHNAFLIHDDIEDRSAMRRGAPTLHERFGVALAINAGDALALAALGVLRTNADRLGHRLGERILDEFDFMSRHTVDGQAMDLGWRIDNRLDLVPADYLDLIMKKTCWYTTVLPLRVGALIGSRLGVDVQPMVDFGFYLGAAFQLQDDLLNATGSLERYGKEPRGDLAEGKRTLMMIHLLAETDGQERRWLEAFLGADRSERTEEDVDRVATLMDRHGSIDFARQFARGVAGSAEEAFERAFADAPGSEARRFVHDLIGYMIERDV